MGLIDDYIETQYEIKSVAAMANQLGLSVPIVRNKLYNMGLEVRGNFAYSRKVQAAEHMDEYKALLNYIKEKKTGVFVDIAKRRLQDIELNVKQLTL